MRTCLGLLLAALLVFGVVACKSASVTDDEDGSGGDAGEGDAGDGDGGDPIHPGDEEDRLVPTPVPIEGAYEIGAYYMPKTRSLSYFWRLVETYNRDPSIRRLPSLGLYDGGDPQVLDWQIKWAVEHGVSFWVFDEFWVAGMDEPVLNDSLRAFLASHHRSYMRFAIMLTSTPTAGTAASLGNELDKILDYWIEHYFGQPEYLTIEGRPLVVIYDPWKLNDELGGDWENGDWAPLGTLQALESRLMQNPAFSQGWFLVWGDFWRSAMDAPSRIPAAAFEQAGFDAVTDYGCPGLIEPQSPYRLGQCISWSGDICVEWDIQTVDYGVFVDRCQEHWLRAVSWLQQAGRARLLIPVTTARDDSATYHGLFGPVNRQTTNPSLDELTRQLNLAAQLAEQSPLQVMSSNGRPLMIFKAWNEWPEGSSIEPGSHEWFTGTGQENLPFAYADTIRDFVRGFPEPHQDLLPADVGMGPYPARPPVSVPVWEFESEDQVADWYASLTATPLLVSAGAATARIYNQLTWPDGTPLPALNASVAVDFDASSYCSVEIRQKACVWDGSGVCKTSGNATTGSFSWRTYDRLLGGTGGLGIPIDDQFHDRVIDLTQFQEWTGRITDLVIVIRPIDPSDFPLQLSIDYLRLLPCP